MFRSLVLIAALAVTAVTGATTASAQYYGYGYPRYADPYAGDKDPYFYPEPSQGPMVDTEIYPKPPVQPYHVPLPPKVPNFVEPYIDKSGLQPYAGPYVPPGYRPYAAPDYQGYAPPPEQRSTYVEPYDGGRYGSRSDYEATANGQTTRTEVANPTKQPPGTIVIDTASRQLYLTEANGQAIRYGIGVGREGFAWKGIAKVQRKAEWPEWIPPSDMMKRRPDLPERMEGGIDNPLGARALYLFKGNKDTLFRIHGTNEPDTIGQAVSSGCIRMMNGDVIDLYKRVPIGTKVVVL